MITEDRDLDELARTSRLCNERVPPSLLCDASSIKKTAIAELAGGGRKQSSLHSGEFSKSSISLTGDQDRVPQGVLHGAILDSYA